MSKLRKHSAKIFFAVSCFLLVLSLGFSAYSFAKYVSHADSDTDGAVVAPVECTFTVDNKGLGSFINAPYMSQITENTQAVKMNRWADSIITVENYGSRGFSYEYGFVFYLQKDFAESAMFQLLELNDTPSAREVQTSSEYSVKKASALYKLENYVAGKKTFGIETTDRTESGVKFKNEYQSVIDDKNELVLASDKAYSHAVLMDGTRTGSLTSTYATYSKDENNVMRFVCPVSVRETRDLSYYRITVDLDRNGEDKYVLHEGETRSFVFRLVLRRERAAEAFKIKWDPSDLWNKDDSGNFTTPKALPSVPEGYECRWSTDAGGNYILGDDGKSPRLQIKSAAEHVWADITVDDCVGLTSPGRVNMVFTQVMRAGGGQG